VEAEAAARQAALEAATSARRLADQAAEVEAERFETEALAVSAALDDPTLRAVIPVATVGLPGPLARSPLGVSRAVVAWCRTAAAGRAGPLAAVAAAGLDVGLTLGEGAPPLELPSAPPGTATLRHRIAGLLSPVGGE
jgi:hypothetical protein